MRVTSIIPNVEYNMQQAEQALATAEQQLSTGLRVNQPSDDPAAAGAMVRSLAASANVDQYTSNVSTMQAQMQTADSAISSMVTALNSAITAGTAGGDGTYSAADLQSCVAQVENALSSVVSAANTSYQGIYLFAGSENTSAPFAAASTTYVSSNGTASSPLNAATALTAGSVTTISDAVTGQSLTFTASAGNTVGTLETAIANAVSAGTLSAGTTAQINAAGQLEIATNSSSDGMVVRTNDAVLGTMEAASGTSVPNAYVYLGNDTVNNVQVGESMTVRTNLPGSQLLTQGAHVIASLGDLISALQSGATQQISDAVNGVTEALNYVDLQRASLDNTISNLNSQESYLSQEKVKLTSQQNSLTGVDSAQAAENLSQAELAYDTVLAAAAKALPETLLDYLQ
jgi:flagellar hook-associated protein 3